MVNTQTGLDLLSGLQIESNQVDTVLNGIIRHLNIDSIWNKRDNGIPENSYEWLNNQLSTGNYMLVRPEDAHGLKEKDKVILITREVFTDSNNTGVPHGVVHAGEISGNIETQGGILTFYLLRKQGILGRKIVEEVALDPAIGIVFKEVTGSPQEG